SGPNVHKVPVKKIEHAGLSFCERRRDLMMSMQHRTRCHWNNRWRRRRETRVGEAGRVGRIAEQRFLALADHIAAAAVSRIATSLTCSSAPTTSPVCPLI